MAEATYAKLLGQERIRDAAIWRNAIEKFLVGNGSYMAALLSARHIPVTIDEFLTSKEYFAEQMDVWPTLMPDLRAANADVLAGADPTFEIMLGGATGTGKTAMAHISSAYQVYSFTCFKDPQKLFGLPSSTPIIFMFQSVSTTVTKRVIYEPFRTMFLSMPYVQKHVGFDKHKESTLDLHGNISVVPALASIQSMVGQAIAGAILDEINFMSVIDNSKQVPGINGQGGLYDQAEVVYRNIVRRKKSRFVTRGPSWGSICVMSSTRYQGDFLDRRIDEVTEMEEPNIIVRRNKQYEMQPKYLVPNYPRFRFLVGTDTYPGRILKDEEIEGTNYPEGAVVENIPIDYLKDFRRDPDGSSRDVIGVASLSISPFISQRHKILQAILRTRDAGRKPWVLEPDVELNADGGMPQWDHDVLMALSQEEKDARWHAHIDLSISNDRCGIGISRVREYTERIVERNGQQIVETVPIYEVGCSISIKPSSLYQIDPTDIRTFLMHLKTFYGLNLYMITYDGFQSYESIKAWRSAGIRSENISLDRGTEGYTYFRSALYDDRIDLTDHDDLRIELTQLEHIKKKDKVDHPPRGAKDISDGVAGSIFSLSKSREVRQVIGYEKGNQNMRHINRERERPVAKQRVVSERGQAKAEEIAKAKAEEQAQTPEQAREWKPMVKPSRPTRTRPPRKEANAFLAEQEAKLKASQHPSKGKAYDIRSEYGD